MPNNAKPSTTPRWAVTAGGTPAANISTPPSGNADTGWTTGQVPPSAWQNFLSYWTFVWLLFLSYFFTDGGQAVGNTDLGATAETNYVPLAKYRDYNQNTRSHVDHNGYRMGQVSEIDEHWRATGSTTITFTPLGSPDSGSTNSAFLRTGSPGANTWKLGVTASTDTVNISLKDIPVGALITSIIIYYANGFGTTYGVIATLYKGDPTATGTATAVVSRTVSIAGSATNHFDIMNSPTSGAGPKVVDAAEMFMLQIATGTGGSNPIYITGVQVTYTSVPPVGWSWTGLSTDGANGADSDAITFGDPFAFSTGLNQRAVLLTSAGGAATNGGSELMSLPEIGFDAANTALVLETMLYANVVDDAAHAAIVDLGFAWTGSPFHEEVVIRYEKIAGSPANTGNWHLTSRNTVGTRHFDADTGVAVANATLYRMRLELVGTALNSGTGIRARAFINGTLVATIQITTPATLPAAGAVRTVFRVGTDTNIATGPYSFAVGRLRRAFNHRLSGDNL